jgi:hypothetical protein
MKGYATVKTIVCPGEKPQTMLAEKTFIRGLPAL